MTSTNNAHTTSVSASPTPLAAATPTVQEEFFFEPLLDAIGRGDDVAVAHIIDIGGFSADLSETDTNGFTCLHWAASSREAERLLPMLLAQGARVEATNNFGQTPLHLCCAQGRLYAVTCLLHKGANPNPQTADTLSTPLHLAVQHDHEDISRLLLAFGADTSIVNAAGETVFDLGLAELLGGS
jgi:ankyrin repeat protein